MSRQPPRIADLDRDTLAVVGREWLLHGHLQDRVAMALVLGTGAGREVMQQVAIEEWMAASPIYSQRVQTALNFSGSGVDTILKNLQLDIGAPHEFMDFRYRLRDAEHGEFWLAHCGALMDVEPMGEDFVRGMCHAIEDPTFDATAAATNPHAQVRPVHRPPRAPADRVPHCHWRIDVVAGDPPAQPHPLQAVLEQSLIASLPVPRVDEADLADGWPDYGGEFDPDFRLELLSHGALVVAVEEFAVQSHLLLRGLLTSAARTVDPDFAADAVPRLVTGWCGLTAQRLRDALDLPPTADGLARMLALHPMFAPTAYVETTVEVGDDGVRLAFGDCRAAHEGDSYTWFSGLGGPVATALEAVAQAFSPQVRMSRIEAAPGELHAFRFTIDPTAEPLPEPAELAIAKISTGATFRFGRPRLVVAPPG